MTGPRYEVTPGGPWTPPPGPPPARNQSRIVVIASIALGVLALVVATASWFRPSESSAVASNQASPEYTEEESEQATRAMCDAYEVAVKAVIGASGSQQEPDPVKSFVMTVDARFAFHVAAEYFRLELEQNPATPPELADKFLDLSAVYDELILAQLARTPDEELESLYAKSTEADSKVVEECR